MYNAFRKSAGTTLIEILVVIVVFTVGILAVVQIFPKGFQILTMNRAAAMATFMARDQMEKLTAHPDLLPDEIVPVDADTLLKDTSINGNSLAFVGTGINSNGTAVLASGNTVDANGNPINWESATGFNNMRGIIGETESLSTPKLVGTDATRFYGSLVTLQFGPTAIHLDNSPNLTNLRVYGNELTRVLTSNSTENPQGNAFTFNPQALTVWLPTGPVGRTFQMSYSGSVLTAANTWAQRSFYQVQTLPATTYDPTTGSYLATQITLGTPNGVPGSVYSIDPESIKVEQIFTLKQKTDQFDADPFEFKVLDPNLGTLLFNPAAFSTVFVRPGGAREALHAKVDYVVKDWRILHEDFRVDASDGTTVSTHQLPIQSLRTRSQPNVDGTPSTGDFANMSFASDDPSDDHFVLIDLATGGTFMEKNLISVDKSRGIISFSDADPGRPGLQGMVLLPDGSTQEVDMADRSVRALYQARYEWAVQVLKAAASYTVTAASPVDGQFYVGYSNPLVGQPYRLYFAPCDTGRKVTIGQLWYERQGDPTVRSMQSQDFQILPAGTSGDTTKLPFIDLQKVDPQAGNFDMTTHGYAARDVKGSSLTVRVIWNPASFTMNGTPQANAQSEATWAQQWRHSTSETFLDQGVTSR